jgi:hypothetical protein
MGRTRVDLVAVAASVLALAMLVVYLWVIRQQQGDPAVWVVAALAVGAAAAGYGSVVAAPYRGASLAFAGVVLLLLGLLAILTIGLPSMVAGGLCFVAFVRRLTAAGSATG